MISLAPVTLEAHGVRLEPLGPQHADDLRVATTDGRIYELWYTKVPAPAEVDAYIAEALDGQAKGTMLPWAVRHLASGRVIGSTRYHDVVAAIDRVEIGYTWYAGSYQRTWLNTACKLTLMTHAFETVGCGVVALRTDQFNFRSQAAIERLGAKKDGVLRRFGTRGDGSVRDVVLYSIIAPEWPDVKRHLSFRLQRLAT